MCQRKTTKEEWTERFKFVYKSSKEYIALSKEVSNAYLNYIVYKNKHFYTDNKETASVTISYLYNIYYDEYKKQYILKVPIIKAFKEQFPSINNSISELDHYLDCCELYEAHRLKGIHYNLPFPLEPETVTAQVNEFDVVIEVSKPIENIIPEKPEGKWEDLKVIRKTSKPLIIKEKKKYPKKHTLSILLTQEKEKTKKLQELLGQTNSK